MQSASPSQRRHYRSESRPLLKGCCYLETFISFSRCRRLFGSGGGGSSSSSAKLFKLRHPLLAKPQRETDSRTPHDATSTQNFLPFAVNFKTVNLKNVKPTAKCALCPPPVPPSFPFPVCASPFFYASMALVAGGCIASEVAAVSFPLGCCDAWQPLPFKCRLCTAVWGESLRFLMSRDNLSRFA
jgi:hypothetical protein